MLCFQKQSPLAIISLLPTTKKFYVIQFIVSPLDGEGLANIITCLFIQTMLTYFLETRDIYMPSFSNQLSYHLIFYFNWKDFCNLYMRNSYLAETLSMS
jgi:hypothetical protein